TPPGSRGGRTPGGRRAGTGRPRAGGLEPAGRPPHRGGALGICRRAPGRASAGRVAEAAGRHRPPHGGAGAAVPGRAPQVRGRVPPAVARLRRPPAPPGGRPLDVPAGTGRTADPGERRSHGGGAPPRSPGDPLVVPAATDLD